MIKKIDDLLIWIAKQIIIMAAFFGISRRQVLIGWIFVSVLFFMFTPLPKTWFTATIDSIFSVTNIFCLIVCAFSTSYREDDILPSGFHIKSRIIRLSTYLIFMILSLPKLFSGNWVVGIFVLILNQWFWPYVCLNQNSNIRVTAKSLLRAFGRKIQEAFTPQPEPVPIPVGN